MGITPKRQGQTQQDKLNSFQHDRLQRQRPHLTPIALIDPLNDSRINVHLKAHQIISKVNNEVARPLQQRLP